MMEPAIVDSESSTISSVSLENFKGLSQEELCSALIQKEYELDCAKDMLQSLAVYEAECQRKDAIIKETRRELASYKQNSHSKDIGYVTMEEHLSACEEHLQLRTKEAEKLRQELATVKKKAAAAETRLSMLSTSASKVVVLQKELAEKTSEILKLKEEVKTVKAQRSSHQEMVSSLRHRVSELQANLTSFQTKEKELKLANDELRQKLKKSENDKRKMSSMEKKHKDEVSQLKSSSGKLAQAKQDFLENEVEKTKQNEHNLAVQLGKAKEETSTLCQSVLSLSSGVLAPVGSSSGPEAAISVVQQLCQELTRAREELEDSQSQLDQLQAESHNLNTALKSLSEAWSVFKEEVVQCSSQPSPCKHVEAALETLTDALRELSQAGSCTVSLAPMEESLKQLKTVFTCQLDDIASKIEEHCTKHSISCEGSTADKLASLAKTLELKQEECSNLIKEIAASKVEHESVKEALKRETEKKTNQAVLDSVLAEKEKFAVEMENLRLSLQVEKQEAVAMEQRETAALGQQLETVKQLLSTESKEKDSLQVKICELKAKLCSVEVSMNESMDASEAVKETIRQQLTEEMMGYKEQSLQHAITIVSLEERLTAVTEQCTQLRADNESLSSAGPSTDAISDQPSSESEELEKYVRLTDTLRNQLSNARDAGVKSQARIKQLETDLDIIKSQITAREAVLTQGYEEQLKDLKLTLSKQESLLEENKIEIASITKTLDEKTNSLVKSNQDLLKSTERVAELETILSKTGSESVEDRVGLSMLASEAGQRCLGERHTETIANQRLALTQLREHISELESAKPPVGSHQATLKELSRVRHELLLAKSKHPTEPVQTPPKPSPPVSSPHQPEPAQNEKLKELQTTIMEMREVVQISEKTYKHLVEVIARILTEIDKPAAWSLDDGKSHEDKKELIKERKKFADSVLKSLKSLQLKANPASSREVTRVPGDKEASPETWIASLQSALDSTSEELEQQLRLNQALIKRTMFKESQLTDSSRKLRHSCVK